MKKQVIAIALIISAGSLTSCYDFNRKQNELDAESNGRAILLEAESSKKPRQRKKVLRLWVRSNH